MISKSQIKLICSLQQKKYRKQEQLFLVEGIKGIQELVQSDFDVHEIFTTNPDLTFSIPGKITIISDTELKKISALATPNSCLALFKIPKATKIAEKGLILALDAIRDPGNLGTIIRLCDWFGIESIFCSENTVDVYNPKVVQATMGSISRVNVFYGDLEMFLKNTKLPVFGTFMEGENIYQKKLEQEGILILGNEANGISENIENLVNQKLTIPRFGKLQRTESLNVATATAIILSEFRR